MKIFFATAMLFLLSVQMGFSQTKELSKSKADSLYNWLDIDEVVVTGTRSAKRLSDSPVLTTVIRDTDIMKAGDASLTQVLEDNIPGLLIYDTGAMGTDMYMKGLTTQYMLVLIDGERLASDGRNGNVNLDQIDVNNIQRVEYINGAASSLYGSNAIAGVINIITKTPNSPCSAVVEYQYESSDKHKYKGSISSKLDKFSIYASGMIGDQGYYVPDSGSILSEYDEYGADLKVQYTPSDRLKLTTTGRYYQIETFNSPQSTAVMHYKDYAITAGGAMSYASKDFKNIIDASVSYNTSRQYYVMEQMNNYEQPTDYNGYLSSKIIDSYKINSKLDVMAGAEFNNETSSSADKLGDGVANKSNYDANLFAQADWDLADDLTAIIGARYTYNEMFGASFNPKLSVMYKLDKFAFRGGVGTAYKAPSLKELYYDFQHTGGGSAIFYISGNPDLKAESGLFASLSAEYNTKKLNISISPYYNNIKDKINMVEIYNPDAPDALADQTYENVGRAIIMGADISLRYAPIKQIIVSCNYTLNDSLDSDTDQQISGTSLHYATLSTTWNSHFKNFPFSLQVAGRISSPRFSYDSDMNQVSTDSFSIWKATFVKPITINRHNFDLTAKVDNVFDFTHDYYTTSGRQFLLGIRYKFN